MNESARRLACATLAFLAAVPSQASDGTVHLSFAGEVRERFEYYSEPFFGLRSVSVDDYLLHRLLLSADLYAGDHWRIFLQLGNFLEAGKKAGRGPARVGARWRKYSPEL